MVEWSSSPDGLENARKQFDAINKRRAEANKDPDNHFRFRAQVIFAKAEAKAKREGTPSILDFFSED